MPTSGPSLIDDSPLTGLHKKLTVFSCGSPFLDGFAPLALLVALAVYAATSGACNFIEIIYPSELFLTSVRATTTGAVVAISWVGSAISFFAVPLLHSESGLGVVMWLVTAVNSAGLAVTVVLGEETRGRPLTETSASTSQRAFPRAHAPSTTADSVRPGPTS